METMQMISRRSAINRPGSVKSVINADPAPLLLRDDHNRPSVFRPENMLREARRQKGLSAEPGPPFCVLDPDVDIVQYVRKNRNAVCCPTWSCYPPKWWAWLECGGRHGIQGTAA